PRHAYRLRGRIPLSGCACHHAADAVGLAEGRARPGGDPGPPRPAAVTPPPPRAPPSTPPPVRSTARRPRRPRHRSGGLFILPLRQPPRRVRRPGQVEHLLQLLHVHLDQRPQLRQLLGELVAGDGVRVLLRLRRPGQREALPLDDVLDALADRHRRVLVAGPQRYVAAQRPQYVAVALLQRPRLVLPLRLGRRRLV